MSDLSQDQIDYITSAANAAGVDPATMIAEAIIESGGDVNAQNPNSSAAGLYQFTDGTAAQYGLTDPYNGEDSANAAAQLAADNNAALAKAGIEVNAGNTYLAHQQGAAGAVALLSNPDESALSVLTDLYGSESAAEDAIRLNGGTTDMSAGDFASIWTDKANEEASAYADPSADEWTPDAPAPLGADDSGGGGLFGGFDLGGIINGGLDALSNGLGDAYQIADNGADMIGKAASDPKTREAAIRAVVASIFGNSPMLKNSGLGIGHAGGQGAFLSSEAPADSPIANADYAENTLLPASMNNDRWLTGY